MQAAPRAAGAHRLPAILRRVVAGADMVPWRKRAFWVTQLLVVGAIGVHVLDDHYGSSLAHMPSVATLVLLVFPIGYAATRFGLRGSLPTAVWTVALMLPDILWLDTGLERWTDGTVLTLVIVVAVAAGRMVDVQRSSTSRLVAVERLQGIARVADQLPEGVCLTDLNGVVTYANPAWAFLQGLASPQAAVGRTLASFHLDGHATPGALLSSSHWVPAGSCARWSSTTAPTGTATGRTSRPPRCSTSVGGRPAGSARCAT